MRPSQDDCIVRECTLALQRHQTQFVYRCLRTAVSQWSVRLSLRLLWLLLVAHFTGPIR